MGGNATGGDGGGTSSLYFCFGGDGAGATAGAAYGAAIYGDVASSLYVYNSLFVSNNITGGCGSGGDGGYSDEHDYYGGPSSCSNGGSGRGGSAVGGAVFGAGKVTLVNCTSVGNTSVAGSGLGGSAGAGSYLRDGYPGVSVNGTGSHGGSYGGAEGSLAANSIFSQDVPNDAPTTNWNHCSFADDPGFILPEVQDYRLSSDSDWLNTGTNSVLPSDDLDLDEDNDLLELLPVDLAGQPRIKDGVVDLGAYEGGIVSIALSIPSSATEGDGVLTATGLVSIPSTLDGDLTVNLLSDDTSEVSVPATAVIPAGNTNASFDITIVDDDILDGVRVVNIEASADIHISSSGTMLIHDDETAMLSLSLPAAATEGDGILTSTGTVSVSSAPVDDVVVTLSCDDSTEVGVPATAIIPAGQTSIDFDVTIIDDNEIDGIQTAYVTAQVNTNWNWSSGTNSVNVLDNEHTNLVVSLPASATEGDGTVSGSVSISGTLDADLSVSLFSDDTTEVTVPATVTIPAGQTLVSFNMTVVDDTDTDGVQTAMITASTTGFISDNATFSVADNDVHHFLIDSVSSPQVAGIGVSVTITAQDVNGTVIPSFSRIVALSGAGDGGPVLLTPSATAAFSSGVWTGSVTIDTVDTAVTLTADDGAGHTGATSAFDVIPGPLDHFEWAAIPSPQHVDIPFEVTITAQDAVDNTVTDFEGSVELLGAGSMGTVYSNSLAQQNNCYYPNTQTFSFTNMPPPVGNGLLTVYADADLGDSSEYLAFRADGTFLGNLFSVGGGEGVPCVKTIELTQAQMEDLTLDGRISFSVTPSSAVGNFYAPQELRLTLAYPAASWGFISRTGSFVAGIWTGTVAVAESASNFVLRADDGSRCTGDSSIFDVIPRPLLTVEVPVEASEGDGVLTATGRVSIVSALDSDLTINLASDDTSEVTVPSSVVIPVGSTNATFDITIIDDSDLDGPRSVAINASVGIYVPYDSMILVHDNESAVLSVTLPDNATEGDGVLAAAGMIAVSAAPAEDIVIPLSCDDNTELTVPASVIILAGQTSSSFDVTIVDDTEIDGTQSVSVTAQVGGAWSNGVDTMDVLDNEDANLVLAIPSSAVEGDGSAAGSVSISGTLDTDLEVTLSSDDTTEVMVPSSVTITAGQTSVSFDLNVLDDPDTDGSQAVTVSADASGFIGHNAVIDVVDNDIHHFAFNAIDPRQTAGVGFDVTITAMDVNDETITSFTNAVGLSGAGDGGAVSLTPTNAGVFADGIWTGTVTVDTIDTTIVLTADDGLGRAGTSTSFDVPSGPLDHFEWGVIAPIQYVDTPFSATLAARDAHTNLVVGFEGHVDFTVPLLGSVSTTNVTIGDGFDSWNYPMSTFYHDSRTQVIYLQNEIGSSCTITSLALHVSTVPGQIMNNWTIRLKHTSLNEYSSSAVWESADWTTVYTENEPRGTTGWREFVFTTPFEYNGSDNLMIDFSMNNSSYTTDGQCSSTSMSPAYRSVCYRTDSGQGDPLGWPDNGYNPTRNRIYNIPNIRLGVELSKLIQVSPIKTGNFIAGMWTGAVTVAESGTNLLLCACDGSGHLGYSASFDVLSMDEEDADDDGVADSWENKYFGHVTNCTADADADGDGQSNLQEYVFGTNPTNAQDAAVMSCRMQSDGMNLDLRSCEKRWYTIEGTDNLMSSNWVVLGRFFGTGTNMALFDPDAAAFDSQYYRIKADVMPNDPASTDSDGDGRNDLFDEDPFSKDSDGDGMPDAWEDAHSLNASASNSVADMLPTKLMP